MAKKKGKLKQVEEGSKRVEIGQYDITVAPSETFGGKTRSQQRRRKTTGDDRFDKGFAAAYLATKAALKSATLPAIPNDRTKDWVVGLPQGAATLQWEEKPKGYYDLVHGTTELFTLPASNHPEGTLVYDIDNGQFYKRNATARTLSIADWTLVPALSPPTEQTYIQELMYDPGNATPIHWADSRDRMITVATLADLDTIPLTHLASGKLVYVVSEKIIYEFSTTPALRSGTINDWKPLLQGLDFYARITDLPTQHLVVGQQGIIRLDLAGNTYGRLVVYEGPTLGWRNVTVRSFFKIRRSDPDQPTDREAGDLQFTMERDHKEIKVFDGTNWQPVLGEDTIKGWIAALSLFEGTAQEVGGRNPGALELDGLPPLALAKTGHYYTWVGTPNYAVTATTPNIGADLGGAILNPGDWLQQANRGTTAAPDMHWVVVGGDLLAKSRGDSLYGMQVWSDGGWETGSLVLFEGKLYRATQGITTGDSKPDLIIAGSVTGRASTESQVTNQASVDSALANNAPDGSNAGKWWITNLGADYQPVGGPLDGVNIPDGSAIMNLGNPTLGTNGWAVEAPPFTVGVPTFGPSPNKWSLVNVGGTGINFYTADGDLPAVGSIGQLVLVLSSARAQGKPVLYTWDNAAAQWSPLGGAGGSGVAIRDMTGNKLINIGLPIGSVTPYAGVNLPNGWLWCDGANFDPAAYPSLSQALGGVNKTPDLRAQFIRGGTHGMIEHDYPHKPDTTALPKGPPFLTGMSGRHSHSYTDPQKGWGAHRSSDAYDAQETRRFHTHNDGTTSTQSDHFHSIVRGGDPETAPKHVIMAYIIKAGERALEVTTP